MPDRSTEIAEFECHAKELVACFVTSLKVCDDAESRIREEFQKDLTGKEETIKQLSEQLSNRNKEVAELERSNEMLLRSLETAKLERDTALERVNVLTQRENESKKLALLLESLQRTLDTGHNENNAT